MNNAFKRLESVVPDIFTGEEQSSSPSLASSSKSTKINTLKLAVNYISALTQLLSQSDSERGNLLMASNENLHSISCEQVNKLNKCHSLQATSANHTEVSQYRDLNTKMCHMKSSHQKVSRFEFESIKPKTDNQHNRIELNKVICQQQQQLQSNTCLEQTQIGVYGQQPMSGHFGSNSVPSTVVGDINLNVSTTSNCTHCHMNNFDLAYSLGSDSQNILDDFSALIEDLHEDNFCLIEDLI